VKARELAPDAMIMPGYDDCILGTAELFGKPTLIAYDKDKVINKLIRKEGMTHDEAYEWFEHNMVGSYVGEGTPVFIMRTS
jgi:hypothetical protein